MILPHRFLWWGGGGGGEKKKKKKKKEFWPPLARWRRHYQSVTGNNSPSPTVEKIMAFVVTEPCFGCKYTDCVVVCPCDCFREGEQMLFIDPEHCIDYGACPCRVSRQSDFLRSLCRKSGRISSTLNPGNVRDLSSDHRSQGTAREPSVEPKSWLAVSVRPGGYIPELGGGVPAGGEDGAAVG